MAFTPEAISYLLPFSNENSWSDLLASMITADPASILKFAEVSGDTSSVLVKREYSKDSGIKKRDRIDLVIASVDSPSDYLIAIECKVLSDLGYEQLDRYSQVFPDKTKRYLVALPYRQLDVPVGWSFLTWPTLIELFANSTDLWVRETASAWLEYLNLSADVDTQSRWNRVISRFGSPIHDLQKKTAYLCDNSETDFTLGASSAGGKPLIAFHREITGFPGMSLHAEVEDANSRGTFEIGEDGETLNVSGLRGFLGIWQDLSSHDEPYQWELLVRAVPVMLESSLSWEGRVAGRKQPVDAENLAALVERGFPHSFAKGYREDTYCEYGGKTKKLGPDATMGEITRFLKELEATASQVLRVLESDQTKKLDN